MKPHQNTPSLTQRILWCAALLAALPACAGPRLEVAAAPSAPSVTLEDAGVRLVILPNTWTGNPSDLGNYYTPVEVRIENDRSDEIQVRYGDFLAVDEAQNQYRAVAPSEVARALFGGGRPLPASRAAVAGWTGARPPVRTAGGPWWPHSYWPYRTWRPFYPYYYPYYFPYYYPYYPYPYSYPYYPYGWPPGTGYDLLTRGLREGRVLPGARVQGFLYLQQATQKGNLLTLSWMPVTADGTPLATLSTEFRIVR
jgi:hypothetical protein